MKIKVIITALLLASCSVHASQLDGANYQADLQAALSKGNCRFYGVDGLVGNYAIGAENNDELVNKYGIIHISGTSDNLQTEEDVKLNSIGKNYAKNYNKALITAINNGQNCK